MSFITRSGRQAGRQQTQLTYHRQQPNPAYQGQFQQPATYPVAQPTPPGATSPIPQQQPQQSQQPSQTLPQASPQQLKMQQQPTIKMEVTTPAKPSMPQASANSTPVVMTHQITVPSQQQPQVQAGGSEMEIAPDAAEPKPWKKHNNKNPTFKVNKVIKRRRQNARFRKLLIPKNAVMVLNELQPGVSFEAEEQMNAFSLVSYTVRINIDGTVYAGEGPSKAAAKAAAAELAVKGLILKKINDSCAKRADAPAIEEDTEAVSGEEASEKGSVNGRRVIPEDEVPWGSLASFALFKLFADWKAQGTNIPTSVEAPAMASKPVLISKPIPKVPGPKPAAPKVLMPEKPETLHPVTLVGRLYPGTVFCEISREGTPPNLTFRIGASVNGTEYSGLARSKKEAKKNCAIEVLKANNVPYNESL